MALIDIQVPDIGDFDEVTVIELMVKVGDTVKSDQSLITVESDKASMEIPCSHAGVVKELKVKLGDKAGASDTIGEAIGQDKIDDLVLKLAVCDGGRDGGRRLPGRNRPAC